MHHDFIERAMAACIAELDEQLASLIPDISTAAEDIARHQPTAALGALSSVAQRLACAHDLYRAIGALHALRGRKP